MYLYNYNNNHINGKFLASINTEFVIPDIDMTAFWFEIL